MKIAQVREQFGVPARRMMKVIPKLGQFMAGHRGRITGTTEHGHLRVRNTGVRLLWSGIYHPHALTYPDSATAKPRSDL